MKKVLIVDNERAFCALAKFNLEWNGEFAVAVCDESHQAVSSARSFMPDAIILDMVMPGKSGVDVAIELKSDTATRHIPIIFLSAVIDQDELEKHRHIIGRTYTASKPVSTAELAGLLRHAMAKGPDVR